jgi:hypothetical protein
MLSKRESSKKSYYSFTYVFKKVIYIYIYIYIYIIWWCNSPGNVIEELVPTKNIVGIDCELWPSTDHTHPLSLSDCYHSKKISGSLAIGTSIGEKDHIILWLPTCDIKVLAT